MRTVLLSKGDELYLQKCATELGFAFGIICGQHAEPEKYITVHLAKNSEEEIEEVIDENEQGSHGPKAVEDIDTQALTNQWIGASKMMPGSFTILGVFITGVNAEIINESSFREAKRLLYDVNNILIQDSNYCGSVDKDEEIEYLFLAYSTAARRAVCKYYTHNVNGGALTDMEYIVVDKPFEWFLFECNYELDDIFPIQNNSLKINIELEFQRTIEAVRRNLAVSEVFIQNENVDETLSVDAYVKKKRNSTEKPQNDPEPYKITIFLPVRCQVRSEHPIRVRHYNGTVRFVGMISSRIWCNPKNTIADVKRFVRDDILRSLAARIQVYCDGLTEPHVSQEAIFISEPPRRVFFNLPTDAGEMQPVQFSEYIFRGEAPTVAVAQAKQILDLDITTESILTDFEGLPDDGSFSDMSSESQSLETIPSTTTRSIKPTIYMLGVAIALLILLISILMNFVLR